MLYTSLAVSRKIAPKPTANRRQVCCSRRQNTQWAVFSFHEKHLYSQIAIHGIREKNIRKSRVGEEKILAWGGSGFFVAAKENGDVNTRRVLTRRFSKPQRKRRAALCQNFWWADTKKCYANAPRASPVEMAWEYAVKGTICFGYYGKGKNYTHKSKFSTFFLAKH